jgi:PrgI family protein
MKFQLPQFIETEVKLIGPFTLKQFLWLGGGGALIFVLFLTLPIFWSVIMAVPIGIVSVAFAFIKVGGVPLVTYFAYMLSYFLNPKKYVYTQSEDNQDILQQIHQK